MIATCVNPTHRKRHIKSGGGGGKPSLLDDTTDNTPTDTSLTLSKPALANAIDLARVLICIPTYNEARNIHNLLECILGAYPALQILIIDDNSQDATRAIVKQIAQNDARVHILERPGKLGLGSAYIDGFMWGLERGFMYFIQMDADLSHHPRYLAQTLQNLGCFDVVINSRNILGGGVRGWGAFRRVLSRFGSVYARVWLGVRIMDFTGGFNAYSGEMLRRIGLGEISSNGYCFQIEMKYRAFRAGASVIELPIVFDDRVEGVSKMSKSIILEALYRTPALRYKILARLLARLGK